MRSVRSSYSVDLLALREEQDPGACLLDDQQGNVRDPRVSTVLEGQVVSDLDLLLVEGSKDSRDEADNDLEAEDQDDLPIREFLELAHLELG